jgi:hypothetical protein
VQQIARYRFDSFMAKGGRSIFLSLVIVFIGTLLTIMICRTVVDVALPNDTELAERGRGPLRGLYITFIQMMDPGNMAQDLDSHSSFKVPAVMSGVAGVVLLSALIAFITTALDIKLSELRKGHSAVIEEEHTLILGWNEQRVVEIIRELMMANEGDPDGATAVILANIDKEKMDDYLHVRLPNTGNVHVVTRFGNESSLVNLEIAAVDSCAAVIALAECDESASDEDKAASDAKVIKTIMAVVASQIEEDWDLNIVAEIFDPRNRKILSDIAGDAITTIDTGDILAKILVQTPHSVGLSVVYNEILSFDGCEMYFENDDWGDIQFSELSYHFPDGVVMGLRHNDGSLSLNPPIDMTVKADDDVLILAEDDSTIEFRPERVEEPTFDMPLAGGRVEIGIEKELILGWTPKAEIILREYAEYVQPGSRVDIMLRRPNEDAKPQIHRIQEQLPDLIIELIDKDPLHMDDLLEIEPFNYDNIIILSQSSETVDAERADSETLIILLLLRNIFRDNPEASANTKLITEVLDSENQGLVARAGVNDFIISNRLVSMLLAQVSESKDIMRVYDDLFDEDGSEIYLKPASLYFSEFPVEVTYADMIHMAQKREEVCLGVKIKKFENAINDNFGVKLIPEKDAVYVLQPDDTLVVLAEDDT